MTGMQMPLVMAGIGEEVKIVSIRAGRGLNQHLADMGLTPGTVIKIINKQGAGPMLIDFRGSRLILGFSAAQKVMVENIVG